jgi:hypothetical protein
MLWVECEVRDDMARSRVMDDVGQALFVKEEEIDPFKGWFGS